MNESLRSKLIEAGVVRPGEVGLRSGEKSKVYFDVKHTYGRPELFNELVDGLAEIIDDQVTCIAGSGIGGIPLAIALQSRHGWPVPLAQLFEAIEMNGK